MRDRARIIADGRSDPDSPTERYQHPYDFVSFCRSVQEIRDQALLGHHSFAGSLIFGEAIFHIVTRQPVHVGSGILMLSEDAGFPKGQVVRGIVRKEGEPIIPGSSIKGAVRSVYEAITSSCVRSCKPRGKINYNKHNRENSQLPSKIASSLSRSAGRIDIELTGVPRNCKEIKSVHGNIPHIKLCPACALFGGMGYQGRLGFSDAKIVKAKLKLEPLGVVPLASPQMHRVGFTSNVNLSRGKEKILVSDLYGRKFYNFSPAVDDGDTSKNDLIDYIPQQTVLEFKLILNGVLKEEFGGILTAFGINHNFPFRLGGGKAIGLGHVNIELDSFSQQPESKDRFRNFKLNSPNITNLQSYTSNLQSDFKRWNPFFYCEGLHQLEIITNEVRPSAEEGNSHVQKK